MKRWAIVTVGLYALLLLALTIPGALLVSIEFSKTNGWQLAGSLSEAWALFREWGYWLWLTVLVAAQALLLLVPVHLAERRLPSRRKLMVPVVTASFLLGNLLLAGLFSILVAVFGDPASAVVEKPAGLAEQLVQQVPPLLSVFQSIGIASGGLLQFFCITTAIGYLLVLWLVWGLVFYHYAQSDQPDDLIRRATRWLLRLSVLEFLVAVPSHIIVRHRNDCCAPIASFWGIVTGLSVMLLAFGPGVFFLFARRMRALKPRDKTMAGEEKGRAD